MGNDVLMAARLAKNDEFYTHYKDIVAELDNYKEFFYGGKIYCPCDTLESNFVKYFQDNFNKFELKELAFSAFADDRFWQLHHEDDFYIINSLETGDIRSEFIQNKMREYDIIVTNPPFSLLKEFIQILENLHKSYILVGNENVLVHPLVFPLIKENKLVTGFNRIKSFTTPEGEEKKFGNTLWLTNLPINKVRPPIKLTHTYSPEEYPMMENYNAINVDRVAAIPIDYDGIMGVPITYLNKHCPNQFEILGYAGGTTKNSGQNYSVHYTPHPEDHGGNAMVDGVRKYGRVFIQRVN